MPKSPAFQFYPKDWLSSRKARRMTPEERGGYIDLLAHSWLEDDCSLPDDDEELAFLSGLNDRWPECSQAIRKCFEKRGDKLFNERLLMEVRKQEAFRKQCSDAGKRSAEARKNKELAKVGATNVQPEGQGRCNSSSLSLSLSSSLSSITSSKKKEKHIYGELKHVRLTDDEHAKLVDKFGEPGCAEWIKTLDEGLDLKDYKYKSHYRAILKWAKNPSQPTSPKYDPQAGEKADMAAKEIRTKQDNINRAMGNLSFARANPDYWADQRIEKEKNFIANTKREIKKLRGEG